MISLATRTKKRVEKEVVLPRWFTDDVVLPYKAGIGHIFLLHGDINGLVVNQDRESEEDSSHIPVRRFLEKALDGRDMVILYNLASGIKFLDSDMEAEFRRVTGIDKGDSSSADPIAAAKAGLAAKRGIPRDPDTCLALIEKVAKSINGVGVIINSTHFIAPASTGGGILLPNERVNVERIKNWGQDEEMREKGALIFLLTEAAAKVSPEIRQQDGEIQTVFVAKPTKEERRDFIDSFVGSSGAKLWDGFTEDMFAHATQGMSLRQILEIFLHAKKTGKPIDLQYVKEKKREILNNEYGDVMEVVEPERGLEDIGGMEHVKLRFAEELKAIARGETRLVSMGITLMGPPGTGKTALVEALARESGFNFVKIKNLRSMWVGESEARAEKLENGLRSLAPVVVMNDEADLMDSNRDAPKGDSGVSERLMKRWMELLSDPRIRGQIIVISCTNRPDRIDAALKRSGRSDERILIPMPSRDEIPEIFRVMFKRYKISTSITDFTPYIELTDGFSGADIEKIVLNASRFAFRKGEDVVDDEVLREAIEDFIPSASQADIDRMTLLGFLESSSRRLLPTNAKEILQKIRERNLIEGIDSLFEQIQERKIIDLDS